MSSLSAPGSFSCVIVWSSALSLFVWCLPSGLHLNSCFPGSFRRLPVEPGSISCHRAAAPATFPGKYTPAPCPLEGCTEPVFETFTANICTNKCFLWGEQRTLVSVTLWHPSFHDPNKLIQNLSLTLTEIAMNSINNCLYCDSEIMHASFPKHTQFQHSRTQTRQSAKKLFKC